MVSQKVTVSNPTGIHARPAATLAKTAAPFKSSIILVADRFDTGGAFSLMDLSVEAEAFGAPVHYSEDEVPTVHGTLINDEDEAEALKTVVEAIESGLGE